MGFAVGIQGFVLLSFHGGDMLVEDFDMDIFLTESITSIEKFSFGRAQLVAELGDFVKEFLVFSTVTAETVYDVREDIVSDLVGGPVCKVAAEEFLQVVSGAEECFVEGFEDFDFFCLGEV